MCSQAHSAYALAQETGWANPHSQHAIGRRARVLLEEGRERVAHLVGRPAKQVRFTSGATEANAWVLNHFLGKGRVLCSAIEHPSVLAWTSDHIAVDGDGRLDLDELRAQLINGGVSLVSVMAANNETGVLQPIADVAQICRDHSTPFHCDATQYYGRLSGEIAADFLSLSAHKFAGPKGIGALILSMELESYLRGGAQERGSRAGTCNVPAASAMGAASEQCTKMSKDQQGLLEAALLREGAQIIGAGVERLPNTTCALFDFPGDLLVMSLDMAGIAVSTGAACSSGSSTESHVLRAMGISGKAVRFSWGADDVLDDVIPVIAQCVRQLRSIS